MTEPARIEQTPARETLPYPPSEKELLDTREAAALLGLRPQTLINWRCAGQYADLRHIALGGGRSIRYRRADLESWLEAHEVGG